MFVFLWQDVITALDEEDHLTNELEKCHEEALASAIAEEENLKEVIEEEENKDITVETDYEGESDLALSTVGILLVRQMSHFLLLRPLIGLQNMHHLGWHLWLVYKACII